MSFKKVHIIAVYKIQSCIIGVETCFKSENREGYALSNCFSFFALVKLFCSVVASAIFIVMPCSTDSDTEPIDEVWNEEDEVIPDFKDPDDY